MISSKVFIWNVTHSIEKSSGRHKGNTKRPKPIGKKKRKEKNKAFRNVKIIRLKSSRNYVIYVDY